MRSLAFEGEQVVAAGIDQDHERMSVGRHGVNRGGIDSKP